MIDTTVTATPLAPGVTALSGTIPLEGIASWAPVLPGRFQSTNCYLLDEGDAYLLVDTGLRVHWDGVRRRLAERMRPGASIRIFMTRPEPDAVGNIDNVRSVYQLADTDVMAGGADSPFDFFATAGARRQGDASGSSTPSVLRTTGFDLSGDRAIRIIVPKLRFLPSYWPFDVRSRTLFTADIFTHVDQGDRVGVTVVDRVEDLPDDDHIASHLFSKFWWLPGATTTAFRDDLLRIFDSLRPEIVAPGYGGILRGQSVVEAHLAALLRVLDSAERGEYGLPSMLEKKR